MALPQPIASLISHRLNMGIRTPRIMCMAAPLNTQPNQSFSTVKQSEVYQPNTWNYASLQSLRSDLLVEPYGPQVERLKGEVTQLLEEVDPLPRLELIDDLQRLGLDYHFKNEIKKSLLDLSVKEDNKASDKGLYTTALCFRLLRQHGFEVSQDAFNGFKDKNGSFMASLSEDPKGLLSLLRASHLAFEGENTLDKARRFATEHLKNLKDDIEPDLREEVVHALELPVHWRMRRLEVRNYIDMYERKEDMNTRLVGWAKYEFNLVQSIHQEELKNLSVWWLNLGLVKRLNFSRDRLMELFFWSAGSIFEPQFGYAREGLTKVFALITIIDDVYDVYGSTEQLEVFTQAVERWSISEVKGLPDVMKICFLALYNTTNEMAYDLLRDEGWDVLAYLHKAWADLCKAFLQETKWGRSRYTPTLEEYFNNGWVSVSGPVMLVHIFFQIKQKLTKEQFQLLETYPDLVRSSSMIFRLCNDLASSTAELESGDVPKSIDCYMNEKGVSEADAHEEIKGQISKAWRELNKHSIANSSFPQPFVTAAIDLARVSHCLYQHGNGLSDPNPILRDQIKSVLLRPII